MQASSNRRFAASASLVAIGICFLSAPALAQNVAPPPVRQPVDENGVDTSTGDFNLTTVDVSIGSGESGMDYVRSINGNSLRDNLTGSMSGNGTVMTVSIGDSSSTFTDASGTFTSEQADGSTLTFNAAAQEYVYATSNGTTAVFAPLAGATNPFANVGYLRSVTKPNGSKWTTHTVTGQYCSVATGSVGNCSGQTTTAVRIQSVTSTSGYQLKLDYASDTPGNLSTLPDWYRVTRVTGINNAVEYCNPTAPTCTLTGNWPQMTYARSGSVETATDAAGGQRVITYDSSQRVVSIQRPGATTPTTTIVYGGGYKVAQVTNDGVTYNYAWLQNYPFETLTRTSPGGSRIVTTHTPTGVVTSDAGADGQYVAYGYDANFRISMISWSWTPAYISYAYDARGNVVETRQISGIPATLPDIVTTAYYDPNCANARLCNKPIWTRDAQGNQTDYSYDAGHGGLLTVTGPAATAGGVRPQVRYNYTPLQAYSRNSTGAIVASGQPTYLLTGISTCQTAASCVGTADEVRTIVNYGPQVAGTINNLLPLSVTNGAGDGSLLATTGYSYDGVGNLTSVDGPLAGTGDTTRLIYDVLRRRTGVIAPAVGSQPNLASRTTYNAYGAATNTNTGTTAGQSDSAFAAMSVVRKVTYTYDANGRRTSERLSTGGTTISVNSFSYDAAGRLDCTAMRMNPAAFGGMPASACTASTAGSFGPDRITKFGYDTAGRQNSTITAYGTADAITEIVYYNGGGNAAFVTDGKGNRTAFTYDVFNRLIRTNFPWPMVGINYSSSNTDYQTYTYDAVGQLTDVRLRDGQVLHYGYDLQGRPVLKQTWSAALGYYETTGYGYDLLGRLTSATGTYPVTYQYDALGRTTGTTLNGIAKGMEYDIAGRLTKLTWQDGFYVSYDNDLLGRVTAIRENGATTGIGVLATYGYDSLGRRNTITYGNGTTRNYVWDNIDRLTGLQINLAGTANDLTIGGSGGTGTAITYNPASQINVLPRSNDSFAWTAHADFDRTYTQNGLNQYGAAGSVAFGYDPRGNLTTSGSQTWTYSAENMLLTDSVSGASLSYDRQGRLYRIAQAGGFYSFDYAGSSLVAELGTANQILRRYVPGPGTDETIVWYEGSGTSDRRFLQSDERGSVVSISDSVGGLLAINRYDAFGIPQAGNVGRFQYTGQTWLAEVGLYNFKARMYSPTLGRFMQTDPIGYGDGLNWYNYVGADPVNRTDPTGLSGDNPCRTAPQTCFYRADPPGYGGNSGITVTGRRYQPSILDLPTSFINVAQILNIEFDLSDTLESAEEIVVTAKKKYICPLPTVGLNGSLRAYDVLGGGFVLDLVYDPNSGNIGATAGVDVGVGFGGSAGAISEGNSMTVARSAPSGWTGSVGVNANVRLGPLAGGVGQTLIGPDGPGFGGASFGLRPGSGATVNANVGARVGYGGQVVSICGD